VLRWWFGFLLVLGSSFVCLCVPVSVSGFVGGGREYEMVSPVYKGGYGASVIGGVAPDGNSALFYSPGVFAGAPTGPVLEWDYISRRVADGWSTLPVMPPTSLLSTLHIHDVSPDLGTVLVLGKPGANEEMAGQDATEEEILLHATTLPDVSANWGLFGGMVLRTFPEEPIELKWEGADRDFCHVIVTNSGKSQYLIEGEPEPGVTGEQVYDISRGCDGEAPSIHNVGLDNKQRSVSPTRRVEIGAAGGACSAEKGASAFNAVADGGRELFFTACTVPGSAKHQLFVRLADSRTIELSRPVGEACVEVPCPAAGSRANGDFIGASEDGSEAFFLTTAPLEPATDHDNGMDLYMAKIGCPVGMPGCGVAERIVTSLVQVSADPNGGEEAGVLGVVRLAQDGSRAYFVATGDLLSVSQQQMLERAGRAVPHSGADNMYVYDSKAGAVAFVADLCSGGEVSGSVEDVRCPNPTGDDNAGFGEAQTTPDGRYLVFATYAQLTSNDTDTARDVYRYDAETGRIQRVSTGERGYHADGNNNSFNASIALADWGGAVGLQYELGVRAISTDGSRVVFTSSEPLSPAATSGLTNAYEWRTGTVEGEEGEVSLLSSGTGESAVEDVVISSTGQDAFFVTSQGLVPADTDGVPDVYDLHTCTTQVPCFPAEPSQTQPCSGDACQGPLTIPAALLIPGSVSQTPEASASSPPSKTVSSAVSKKAKQKAKNRTKRHRKTKKSTSKARR
jgi:hypothetical protein